MVSIGVGKRGLGFTPSKSSPLSNRSHRMSEDYERDGAGRKQVIVNRQAEIRHKQGRSRERSKDRGELEDTNKNDSRYNSDSDGEQDKDPGEVLDILQTFPIFKEAPDSFVKKVVSELRFKVYNNEEYVIRKGEPSESMYWILKGIVLVSDGESIQAELGPGSFFGEIGLIFNRRRTATVKTRSKVVVGVLESEALNLVLRYYPSIERRIRDEAQGRLALQDKKWKPRVLKCNQNNGNARVCQDDLMNNYVSSYKSLRDFSIFQQIPSYIVDELLSCVEIAKFPLFDYVFNKGDRDVDVYFIISGQVEIVDTDLYSKSSRKLAVLEEGRSFGILSFLSYLKGNESSKRRASVMTVSPVEVFKIRSSKMKSLCNQFSSIIDELEHECQGRGPLASYNSKFTDLRSPPTTRLSIDYLINENEDNWTKISNNSQSAKDLKIQHQSISNLACSSKYENVPPISPISPVENIDLSSVQSYSLTTREQPINSKKRKFANEKYSLDSLDSLSSTEVAKNEFKDLEDIKCDETLNGKRLKLRNKDEEPLPRNNDSVTEKSLLKVFEYLTIPELMKLRRVCKKWNEILSTSAGLCKNLDLTPWNTSIDDKSLISITDFVGARPQRIDISNCFHVTDEGFTYMVNEIGISGKIINLKMESNWEISGMAIMDLSVSIVGRHLETIDLANCRKVRDEVIERLTGWDSSDNHQMNDDLKEDSGKISDFSVGCKNLKTINVGYCKHLTDNIMYHISQNANTRLESLNLTRCTTISDQGFEYWSKRNFPNLKRLSLKDCTFLTDKSIIAIANSANNLEILDLKFCCALSDVSIDMLSLGCPKLRHLDLSFCGSAVSDFSLVTISLHLRFLEKLFLKGCIRVTRAGIDSLLSGCSSLNYLNISQCKNAHIYPGGIPAQKLKIHGPTKTAFVTAGAHRNIIEIAV